LQHDCSIFASSVSARGAIDHNGETFFASLDFNVAGQALPPVDPVAVVAALPTMCWGVTLFDILIMNGDRHQGNVAFNTLTSELQIFDHSHAFMAPSGDVDVRMAQCVTTLAIGGHCLARELNTWHGFDDWINRISQLPDFCIEGAVQAGCEVGLPQARQVAISDFLKARRDGLGQLVASNVASFPRLPARPQAAPAPPPAGVGAAPIAPAP
jgi:hypothetical protein